MGDAIPGRLVDLVPVSREAAAALLSGKDPGVALSPGYPHADTADALSGSAAGEGPAEGCWFVVRRGDGLVVGDIGWRTGPDAEGAVEIGYGLAEPARGHGLGQDAVATFVEWVRRQPGVLTVVAEVLADNLPSRRLLERIGFTLDRAAPPHLVYALRAEP